MAKFISREKLSKKARKELDKDHALLRDYALASAQLANVSMVEDFITGFRMGAQIMMAVLLPDGQSPEQIGKASHDE